MNGYVYAIVCPGFPRHSTGNASVAAASLVCPLPYLSDRLATWDSWAIPSSRSLFLLPDPTYENHRWCYSEQASAVLGFLCGLANLRRRPYVSMF